MDHISHYQLHALKLGMATACQILPSGCILPKESFFYDD